MSPLTYRTGDATQPETTTPFVIVHLVNDLGKWGRGFVLAVSARWPQVETAYREWAAGQGQLGDAPFQLGAVQFVQIAPQGWVANCVAQHGVRTPGRGGPAPIRYEALTGTLTAVATFARDRRATVHAPRIGAGLAGGDWATIEAIVQRTLGAEDIPVTIYDLPDTPTRRVGR